MNSNDAQSGNFEPRTSLPSPRALLKREWPYLLVVVLALFGIAYTTISRTPMSLYWIAFAPLHWTAVLLAMHLMFVADVASMLNTDSGALAVLTLLALGTFTAGLHIGAWRISSV
jgi:hypothetical protein